MAPSILIVSGSRSVSLPQHAFTSIVLSSKSFVNWSCSAPPYFCDNFCRRSSIFCSSSRIWRSSATMFCFIFSVFAVLVRMKLSNRCWSNSKACSVSWEFWIKCRFRSSRATKTSNNCFGSLKNKGISSPLETSWYSFSKCSRFGYRLLIFLLLASSSRCRSFSASSASRCGLRRALETCSPYFSSKAFSSAAISSCILASDCASLSSTHAFLRFAFRSRFSSAILILNSCGVSFTRKSLYFKHSSFISRCFVISLWRAAN
mmetsp:Transcript_55368/g.160733  ORF Transcript_55368/g.160733 Transcript_55368/m.160733 type:complete len:261 (+) Transcript_55368:505-1287(+)